MECAGLYLLKRPQRTVHSMPSPPQMGYKTIHGKFNVDPYAAEWRIARVHKREGSPYPDRFSIGRAPNCDIVLRIPFISKVHAHIFRDGPHLYRLRDNDAANLTYHNGRQLEPRTSCALKVGDAVSFGSLNFEFTDARGVYEALRPLALT